MLTRLLFLFSLVLGSTILLTGAWTGSLTLPTPNSEIHFVPQAIQLDADIIGSGIDAKQLLQKALEKLDPKRTPWLKTKIRQTMTDKNLNFIAHGYLQRGPNHCARLELNLGKHGCFLVVSDGEVMAQVCKIPGAAPTVEVTHLPIPPDDSKVDAEALKEGYLDDKSCGGPGELLRQLHRDLGDSRLQTGLLQQSPVIQIHGNLNPTSKKSDTFSANSACHACVYLDAKTLWPVRLEWWGAEKATLPSRPILCIEFLEPVINCVLSGEECMRTFSYRPDGQSSQ